MPECKTMCAKQDTAVLMSAVVFHHSLVYRSVTWIWPWLIMHISFVCVNCQVRLQVLKDQSLFQAWYPPKIKSHVLQDMGNLTDWFNPCGSIEIVNVKYFIHDIREKRMGGVKFIDTIHSSLEFKIVITLIIYLITIFLCLSSLLRFSNVSYDMLVTFFYLILCNDIHPF